MKLLSELLLLVFVVSCTSKPARVVKQGSEGQRVSQAPAIDSNNLLNESFCEEDVSSNEYLENILKPIRENFRKINTIPVKEWSLIFSKDLDISAEGGSATFYFYNELLNKIVVRAYGESGQILREYYLMDGKLSFLLEKEATYNRPFYNDSAYAKENNDTTVFDINKSEEAETRYYFRNNILLHMSASGDYGAPWAVEFLKEEEKRTLTDFQNLLSLSKVQ